MNLKCWNSIVAQVLVLAIFSSQWFLYICWNCVFERKTKMNIVKNCVMPTSEAKQAVKSVEKAVKRIVYDPMKSLERTPEKDLLERRIYMQSSEFWNDANNKEVWELSENVIKARDFAKERMENTVLRASAVQAPDGYIVNKDIKRRFDSFDNKGHRMTPPDLTDGNIAYHVAKSELHGKCLDLKGEKRPLWCWKNMIDDWKSNILYLYPKS